MLDAESIEFAKRVPPAARTVMDYLRDAGFEAYAVGGCVRDTLLGRQPQDWDITTNATPGQMKQAVRLRSFDTGLKHGTITFVVDRQPIETTTFRVDGAYTDGRHPDSVAFARRVEDDLARRDFTVNAMAWSDETGLVDPFGGAADLRAGVLRCVGRAESRFAEDGLRIMRALRFAAVYGFSIDDETMRALHEQRQMLAAVSRERIATELSRMMEAPDGHHLAKVVTAHSDVMVEILPELAPCLDFDQRNPHHDRDCWTHMVDTMAGVGPDPTLRLAALLHDVGKPSCMSVDDNGNAHYQGHAEEGARLATTALRRLTFPRASIEEVALLIREHDTWPSPTTRSARRFLARCGGKTRARKLLALMKADRLAHTPPPSDDPLDDLLAFEPLLEAAIAEESALSVKDLAIHGTDLIERGWEAGPALGAELDRLFQQVLDGELPNTREALLAALAVKPPTL